MPAAARYVHTNLVARDWRRLVEFYVEVFGCEPAGPGRDLTGEWLETLTRVPGARIRGAHLRLPGHGGSGPTIEIFTYDESPEASLPAANRPGYGHIAFEVDDVGASLHEVVAHGGGVLGGPVRTQVADVGELEVAYARDPEGNIVEIQRWRR